MTSFPYDVMITSFLQNYYVIRCKNVLKSIISQFYTEERDISLIFIFIMLTRVPLTSNIVMVQIITFPKKNLEKNIECKLPPHLSEIW